MNGPMPSWLARWLGVSPTSATGDATWQLDSTWTLPPWATLLLILAAILFVSILYSREAPSASRVQRAFLAGLRLVALGILLIMLAQWAIAIRLTGPSAMALIIDTSASMTIADQYDVAELPATVRERLVAAGLSEPTRLNLAKLLTLENNGSLLHLLAAKYRLHIYFVSAEIQPIKTPNDLNQAQDAIRALSADGATAGATCLGDAVGQVLDEFRGVPPAAIVLLTDGVSTEGIPLADAVEDARRAGVPIFSIGLGSSRQPRDIEVADVLVDEAVFVGDLVSLQVHLRASGLSGQQAAVTLRNEGDPNTIATESIALPADGKTLTIQLVDRPATAGTRKYVVEIAPRDDETNKQNNRLQRTVAVRDEKIRVFLVQGYPSYEFRFLKALLERDPRIKLSTYLQDADPEYSDQDKSALRSLPVGRDDLFAYDVVVVGDVDSRLAPQTFWQNIRSFVSEKGGGAAFIAGPRNLPWLYADNPDVAALLPIELNELRSGSTEQLPPDVSRGFLVQPTPLGLQSPLLQLGDTTTQSQHIWNELAPLYWLVEADDLKPAAQVLAKGANFPVICLQYFGAGRVLYHGIDSTWRWRLGPGDLYFARYWLQAIRFLARGSLNAGRGAQLTTDRREYASGEPVQLRLRFLDPRLTPADDEVIVAAESPSQPRRRLTLHRNPSAERLFEGALSALPKGSYDVVVVEPQISGNPPATRFTVVARPGEFARPVMDAAALTAAAERTRGHFYTIASADRLLAELPAGRRVPIENLPPFPIWNRWWLLAAFLSCLTTEWILRKRKGML